MRKLVKKKKVERYLTLKQVSILSGISWPTAIDYAKNEKCLRFKRFNEEKKRFEYSVGAVKLFKELKEEAIARRGPKRKKKKSTTQLTDIGTSTGKHKEPEKNIDLDKFIFPELF